MKILAVVLCALVALPAVAEAASKQKRKVHHGVRAPYAVQQPQIACTDVGCLPVPRGCYPTGGKTFDGSPSGFDVMVCPGRGTMYGHL
jgi:hypothetical protein